MGQSYRAETNGIPVLKGKTPFILTICSGKGGVGKSFLSANLACMLSLRNTPVILWDADRHFPNQHLLFGVEPLLRLADVYAGRILPGKALFPVNDYLSLLADKQMPGYDGKEIASHIVYVLKELSAQSQAEIIIMDTPAGVSDEVIQCCAIADKIAVVITDEPTSLLDAYGLIKILLPYVEPENFVLIVNNIIDAEDATDVAKKLNLVTEKFLNIHIPMIGFVPYDRSVRMSIIRQEPLCTSFPDSEAAAHVAEISTEVLKQSRAHR